MLTIRSATVDDAAAIADVHVRAWRSAYRDILPRSYLDELSTADRCERWQAMLDCLSPQEFCFVAELNGQVIGFAQGGPERASDPEFAGELYAIYILEQYRGQGVGYALFKKSHQVLRAREFPAMKLWVLRDNPSRAFYEQQAGVLLSETKTVMIGDNPFVEVAYGWRSVD